MAVVASRWSRSWSLRVCGMLVVASAGVACGACQDGSSSHPNPPPPPPPDPPPRTAIALDGWRLASSADVSVADAVVASTAYTPQGGWHPAQVPGTVVGALVADHTYADPYVGMNLRDLPGGKDYAVGEEFYRRNMSAANPSHVPWWYRVPVTLTAPAPGRRLWLRVDGVNYRAAVWLDGQRLADEHQVVGAFRSFLFDVTDVARAGDNVLALKVTAATLDDLAINWVDWAPFPPDKNQGLWRPVALYSTGPVALDPPHVVTDLDPSLASARLTVTVVARNPGATAAHVHLDGRIEAASSPGAEPGPAPAMIPIATDVDLAAGEIRELRLGPDQVPALAMAHPRLWWPAPLGPQNLYTLTVRATVDGAASDEVSARFGVRRVTTELTSAGSRLFRVNGHRVLIRGAGWAPDLLLRDEPDRVDAQIAYVKDMHLDAVRLEGKLGDPRLLDRCDEEGILVIAGWCCCDHWEAPDDWTDENHVVAASSLEDQARLLRTHPSVLVWLNGSDDPATPATEQVYVDALHRLDWPGAVIASAGKYDSPVTGPTGVKMTGPYGWVPPNYWALDRDRGGAFGFNTETSMGPGVPVVESLERFLPADHRWPVDGVWSFHAGGSKTTQDLGSYIAGLDGRYGASASIDDFARRSQMASYEGVRAMFEAFGRNKYVATGVVQWMLDAPWPGLIWQLYDWYLAPGGGYFGAKKACEPLHVQYGYDDRAIVVVNSTATASHGLLVRAQLLDLAGQVRWSHDATIDVDDDGVVTAMASPDPATVDGIGTSYFLVARLWSATGALVSDNVYWLSKKADVLDWAHANWFATPTLGYADLTGLAHLAPATVTVAATRAGDEVHVTINHAGGPLAFFVRAQVVRASDGSEVLPVRWSDNYVTLAPGERRELVAKVRAADAGGAVTVRLSGPNVAVITAAASLRGARTP
jgi:exo-1,4-beta-D-glucosaminidase